MSTKRKQCSECPWVVRNIHNDKLISNINRFVENGSKETTEHKCHMIDSNIWGKPTKINVCIGSVSKP